MAEIGGRLKTLIVFLLQSPDVLLQLPRNGFHLTSSHVYSSLQQDGKAKSY